MKIILRQDHEKLGKIGDIVEVSDGYARNHLIPRNIGYAATAGNLRTLEEEKKQHSNRKHKEQHNAEKMASELEKISITLKMKVGEDERLFGSVTSQMIADALQEKGLTVDKRIIDTVNLKLHSEVSGKVKVWVVRE
jgi:large subunit ribosomal protein L9